MSGSHDADVLDALYRHVLQGEAEPAVGQVRAGADGYAPDASSAVRVTKALLA